ncbi:glycoside hydrolase family 43 protein [Paraglaciecola hydrolytica]|uniref:Glycosyl hydrolase n=1 Tax=Paraglaciecola hydrolytica TaxID=1799789 RepID=A0A148KMP7_9ALTE|nr:glycoside hydrolase family 43 protein [Paraglaciecola hydrolytica]KXI27567.1 hypothetical protein AX660_01030 [Paraglaciecola hydrolytica]
MLQTKVFRLWIILFGIVSLAACDMLESQLPADDVYLFSSFRANGQDGLHLAASQDGLSWLPLNQDKSVLTPEIGGKLMRDPCIILGPDNVFHMVWTTGWQDKGIGIAHSKDLINWSEQEYLEVMAPFAEARNAWAPEITWDADKQQYLIYWASTLAGKYPETEKTADKGWDHRIYATTTQDFSNYSDTFLYYQPDFNVIDATIAIRANGYVMIVKDETRYPPAKNLKVAFSQSMAGPWQVAEQPFSPQDLWVEGPTILQIGQWYYVYFDAYTEHHYGVMRTQDFSNWQDVSAQLQMPQGSRHGSILRVTSSRVQSLMQLSTATQRQVN